MFNVPYLLSFLSRTITLQRGDIISSGTLFGVGMGRNPQVWLKDGDVTEIAIENIGLLTTTYQAETD
ncbi:fumarylacetoacetate hydrolase family protein [Paenibacillus aestuarii]|uniref:Fumarylacetoacetate hydrolase family protein n=1 Tax=Paenibacillus aestuarii TaxID=516965 RepID=A0ABW0K795_9BACL|nr:fumarylacetoacetate hydrolase family protein [Paenibacillus aestuarii]